MDEWADELKRRRIEQNISQEELASMVNITRQYLGLIEKKAKIPSDDLMRRLDLVLKMQDPLFLLVDYVRIRFKTNDVKHVIEDILRIKMKHVGQEDYGFYGFNAHYYIGDIIILFSSEEDKGVLLELKGRGCRQFECYLAAQKRSWYEFFDTCIVKEKAVMKRLDLAINDRVGILDISVLIQKCKNDECVSLFKSFKDYGSGELVSAREDNRREMGKTLYIGSMKSDVYFCIYEKAYEQYIKMGVPVEESEVKNRFEIRLKNERAEQAVLDLIEFRDGERTAFSIINNYLYFVDREKGKAKRDWKVNKNWLWFVGENREKLKLTTKPEPYEINKTRNWMTHQVAASQKMLAEIDKIMGTSFLSDMMKNAKLSVKHERIIKQVTGNLEDIIC